MSADVAKQLQAGLGHHQSGRLREAEAIYQSILREHPQHPDALHLLGVVALQAGNADAAVDLIQRAIKANPREPQFHNMCGEAYRALRKYDLAIGHYEQALAINANFAGAHINLGNVFMDMKRFEDARACYQKAITIEPRMPMSHNNLGIALKELGRAEEAVAHHKQAIAIMPNYAEAHSSLGNALAESGNLEEAKSHHEKALAIRPDYAEAHSNLGNVLKELDRPDEAVTHYRRALALQPKFAMAHYNLGIVLDELDRPEDAVSCYEQALAIDPDYAEAHHNLGNALDKLGRREDAIGHYEQALSIKPDYAEAHRNLARLQPQENRAPQITKLLGSPSLSKPDAIHCHFALGNIYHDAGSFEQAFDHYHSGNTLKRETISYDSADFSAHVDNLIAAYSEAYFRDAQASGSQSELPVFILGMPRSGTSLVEQIVSSHPQVYGAGELVSIARFEKAIAKQFGTSTPYPQCMSQCYASVAPDFAEQYLEQLRTFSKDAHQISDKMPDNFMRIGLIKTLFPKARIIHCRRNALDTCTSNYMTYFATGNEYSFDLRELGHYYLEYDRLMTHWERLFSTEILTVQYEELISNQEKFSRQMIEYLGLEWDERCLDFHQNERAVHNFSSMQVRQPIYTGAVNRWKRYEKQLAPLIEILPNAATNVPV